MKNLIFILVLLGSGLGFAQESEITGSVIDGEFKNEPLVFAKRNVINTDQIIYTDLEEKFNLNLTPGT